MIGLLCNDASGCQPAVLKKVKVVVWEEIRAYDGFAWLEIHEGQFGNEYKQEDMK